MFAASNNGLSVRAVDPTTPLAQGELIVSVEYPTAAQLTAAFPGYSAAYAALTAAAKTYTPTQFLARFLQPEISAIMAAAQTNPSVLSFVMQAAATPSIQLTDPLLLTGMTLLVSLGLLTSARSTAILTSP